MATVIYVRLAFVVASDGTTTELRISRFIAEES